MEAVVQYNYVAQELDELTIYKGDIITDIKVLIGGWWEGTLRNKRGMFPDNFVKAFDSTSFNEMESYEETNSNLNAKIPFPNGNRRKFCKVLFSYEPCNEDELKLMPNEVIEYLGEVEDGWWRGRLKDKIGVFPSNFVFPTIKDPEMIKNEDAKELCKVVFPYEAANEDELTLREGDLINVLSRHAPDKGWWKGELNGQVGLFPDNFVELIVTKNELYRKKHYNEQTNKSTTTNTTPSNPHVENKYEMVLNRKIVGSSNSSNSVSLSTKADDPTSKTSELTNHTVSSLEPAAQSTCKGAGIENVSDEPGLFNEQLDRVEREGEPLSHLTVSRAKAPRRRLPSSQHLKMQNNNENRRKPLKSNPENSKVQVLELDPMKGKDIHPDSEKNEIIHDHPSCYANIISKKDGDSGSNQLDDEKSALMQADYNHNSESQTLSNDDNIPFPGSHTIYNQLLERVAVLEENQVLLQQTMKQLSEKISHFISTKNFEK